MSTAAAHVRRALGRRIAPAVPAPDETLQAGLVRRLRRLIADGAIAPGDRLPSQRLLADDLGVSRNTVVAAIEQLVDEGLLEARAGSGTYVSALQPARSRAAGETPLATPLTFGSTDIDLFPRPLWRRLQAQRWKRMSASALSRLHHAGWPDLRRTLAAHLAAARGLHCAPEQVFVVAGTTTALRLVIRALEPRRPVCLVEAHGFPEAWRALEGAGFSLAPVAVDLHGICVNAAPCEFGLVYVTPGAQFPTGVHMSASRRGALLALADAAGAIVVEDDYGAEFCFEAPAPTPLAAGPDAARVVFVSSLSPFLMPSIRWTVVVAPAPLAERFEDAAAALGLAAGAPEQMVLHDFFEQGHFDANWRRVRDIYGERRDVLRAALAERCGIGAAKSAGAGAQVLARLDDDIAEVALVRAATDAGVATTGLSELTHCGLFSGASRTGLVLGYAAHAPGAIRQATAILARCLERSERRRQ